MTDRPRRRLGIDLTPLRTSRDYRLVFIGGSISGFGSFIIEETLADLASFEATGRMVLK